jgi:hypothetical protein
MKELNPTSEIIQKYRDTCIFYLKLDLTIFISLFTIISILKLERIEIFSLIFSFKIPLIAFIIIILYGVLLDYLLLEAWTKSKFNADLSFPKWVDRMFHLQWILNIVFIASIGTFLITYISLYFKNIGLSQ